MTRRKFLQLVGQVGGASAVYGAIDALGFGAPAPPPATAPATTNPIDRFVRKTPFALKGSVAPNRKVIILGAGVAGLCAAYELNKAGYDCRILEGRTRVGGRAHTVRRGTVEIEIDGRAQTC